MPGLVEARMKEMGIVLPVAASPAANYVPWVVSGKTVYVAGQIPVQDGVPQYVGKLGAEFDIPAGQQAARLCAMNILAQLRNACGGDLDRVARCCKVGGFVNCTPEFTDMPLVVNGASDLIVAVLGEAGRHARFAVGANGLPRGVAVEIDAIFELK